MHRESPAVQCLPIYLPNEHYVNFHAYQTVNEVLARKNVKKTQLTAWFDYNSTHDNGLCKGTPNPRLQSPFQSSRAIL